MSQPFELRGLHHLTAICDDAQRTIDFYSGLLGLRLVKTTVNFDDPASYHLYFGDAVGTPGSVITFFEWPGAPRGHTGVGGTHHLALQVKSRDGLLRWKRRLQDAGLSVVGPYDRRYFESIYFNDPDGLILEIATLGVGFTVDEPRESLGETIVPPPAGLLKGQRDEVAIAALTWPEPMPEIAADMSLRAGMHHISAISSDLERTDAFLRGVLGLRRVKQTANFDLPGEGHWYWGDATGRPGTLITYFGASHAKARRLRMGVGVTHHYAFAVENDDAQAWFRDRLLAEGEAASPVMDRIYFRSVYSRDPDGHVVELATAGPGFLIDESVEELGTALKLPPWLEPDRATITAGLRPVRARTTDLRGSAAASYTAPVAGPHQGREVVHAGAPLAEARVAMVMVHGRGATAESILELAAEFHQPGLAYLAPQAAGNSWYPQSFLADIPRNEPWLSSALDALRDVLARIEGAGIPAERTILLGFSQGACLALEFAARGARRYGGLVGLSGGLIGPPGTPRAYPGSLGGAPVFLGCSDRDPHIPKERVEETAEILTRLGGEVEMRIYPNFGHSVNEDELVWVRGLLSVFA